MFTVKPLVSSLARTSLEMITCKNLNTVFGLETKPGGFHEGGRLRELRAI
jgi:hypothetical protein